MAATPTPPTNENIADAATDDKAYGIVKKYAKDTADFADKAVRESNRAKKDAQDARNEGLTNQKVVDAWNKVGTTVSAGASVSVLGTAKRTKRKQILDDFLKNRSPALTPEQEVASRKALNPVTPTSVATAKTKAAATSEGLALATAKAKAAATPVGITLADFKAKAAATSEGLALVTAENGVKLAKVKRDKELDAIATSTTSSPEAKDLVKAIKDAEAAEAKAIAVAELITDASDRAKAIEEAKKAKNDDINKAIPVKNGTTKAIDEVKDILDAQFKLAVKKGERDTAQTTYDATPEAEDVKSVQGAYDVTSQAKAVKKAQKAYDATSEAKDVKNAQAAYEETDEYKKELEDENTPEVIAARELAANFKKSPDVRNILSVEAEIESDDEVIGVRALEAKAKAEAIKADEAKAEAIKAGEYVPLKEANITELSAFVKSKIEYYDSEENLKKNKEFLEKAISKTLPAGTTPPTVNLGNGMGKDENKYVGATLPDGGTFKMHGAQSEYTGDPLCPEKDVEIDAEIIVRTYKEKGLDILTITGTDEFCIAMDKAVEKINKEAIEEAEKDHVSSGNDKATFNPDNVTGLVTLVDKEAQDADKKTYGDLKTEWANAGADTTKQGDFVDKMKNKYGITVDPTTDVEKALEGYSKGTTGASFTLAKIETAKNKAEAKAGKPLSFAERAKLRQQNIR